MNFETFGTYYGSYSTNLVFAVQATLVRNMGDGWTAVRQVPTFYLNGNVQGFTDEDGASKIAQTILNPTNDPTLCAEIHVERV